jgi:hypothetical protein
VLEQVLGALAGAAASEGTRRVPGALDLRVPADEAPQASAMWTLWTENCRSCRIDGSATLTIDASTKSRNGDRAQQGERQLAATRRKEW